MLEDIRELKGVEHSLQWQDSMQNLGERYQAADFAMLESLI